MRKESGRFIQEPSDCCDSNCSFFLQDPETILSLCEESKEARELYNEEILGKFGKLKQKIVLGPKLKPNVELKRFGEQEFFKTAKDAEPEIVISCARRPAGVVCQTTKNLMTISASNRSRYTGHKNAKGKFKRR